MITKNDRITKAALLINTLAPYVKDAALLAHYEHQHDYHLRDLLKEGKQLREAINELEAAVAEAQQTAKEVA